MKNPLQIRSIRIAENNPLRAEGGNYDSYVEILLKLIPAEVVAAYLTIQGIVGSKVGSANGTLLYVATTLLIISTPLVLRRLRKVTSRSQIMLTTLAFPVWLFSTAAPLFSYFGGWWMGPEREKLAAVLLVLFVFGIPLFYSPSSMLPEK